MYDIANTTKPLVPENHRVMIDDIRGLVVAKTAHGYEYKDINDSDVAVFIKKHMHLQERPEDPRDNLYMGPNPEYREIMESGAKYLERGAELSTLWLSNQVPWGRDPQESPKQSGWPWMPDTIPTDLARLLTWTRKIP